jgi:exoribonuclease R
MRKVIDLLMKQITKAKLSGKPKEFIKKLQQQLDKIIKNESNNKREN